MAGFCKVKVTAAVCLCQCFKMSVRGSNRGLGGVCRIRCEGQYMFARGRHSLGKTSAQLLEIQTFLGGQVQDRNMGIPAGA